jgi:ADP-heptose:LPS heptosyltransferase
MKESQGGIVVSGSPIVASRRTSRAARSAVTPTAMTTTVPRRVAVFRALQLGDMLCAVPALASLRRGLPGSQITLIGLPWAAAFVDRYSHLLDAFVAFPGHAALPEQPADEAGLTRFLDEMRREPFDLVLQMQGNGTVTNDLLGEMGARRLAGFAVDPGATGSPDDFLAYPEGIPEVERHLRLMRFLGFPPVEDHVPFPVRAEDLSEVASLPELASVASGRYACVHPGSRANERRWSAQGFAQVADAMADDGLRVVITGTADERALAEDVAAAMRHAPVIVTGRTSLGGLAALLLQSALLISNDTGVSHLAAALRVPSVVLFSASDPVRWAPLDAERHRVVLAADPAAARLAVLHARELVEARAR